MVSYSSPCSREFVNVALTFCLALAWPREGSQSMALIMSFLFSKEGRDGWEDGAGVAPLFFLTVKRPSARRQ